MRQTIYYFLPKILISFQMQLQKLWFPYRFLRFLIAFISKVNKKHFMENSSQWKWIFQFQFLSLFYFFYIGSKYLKLIIIERISFLSFFLFNFFFYFRKKKGNKWTASKTQTQYVVASLLWAHVAHVETNKKNTKTMKMLHTHIHFHSVI